MSEFVDLDPAFAPLYDRCRHATLTSVERMYALYKAVEYVIDAGIAGDFVECGVWRGGSVMLIAETLLAKGVDDRRIHVYDTFEGMAPSTAHDRDFRDRDAEAIRAELAARGEAGWCLAPLDEVAANLAGTGYPFDRFTFVQGKVEDTLPGAAPESIALLRLDTDWYESTRCELEILWPRLAPGGVLIVDDYGHWQGARRAVDEYFAAPGRTVLMNRIDYTGRICVKAAPDRAAPAGAGAGVAAVAGEPAPRHDAIGRTEGEDAASAGRLGSRSDMHARDWSLEADAIAASAREWAAVLRSKPFVNNNGMAPDTAFYLWRWVRELAPELIVESGAWRGFSTWVMRQAAPEAKIISLDPIFALGHCIDPGRLGSVWRPDDVERTGADFSCCGFEFVAKPASSLVLFDDHQNKIHRLQQAIQKGFRHVIFDDNLPGAATHLTFFHYLRDPEIKAWMEQVVERFEVFPPLWDTQAGMRNEVFVPGLNIPRDPELAELDTTGQARSGYTWLTYVKVRDAHVRAARV